MASSPPSELPSATPSPRSASPSSLSTSAGSAPSPLPTPTGPAAGGRLGAAELAEQLGGGRVRVIDVREPVEYASGHIAGSRNIPLAQLERAALPDGPLVLLCQSGNRSARGVQLLRQRRHAAGVWDLEGGLPAWEQAGFPIERRSGAPLPLMRQVQIAAGSLVLLGLILSSAVAPAWILLTWLVGAGLVFAGLSGYCGMALLLARMPWNRVRP